MSQLYSSTPAKHSHAYNLFILFSACQDTQGHLTDKSVKYTTWYEGKRTNLLKHAVMFIAFVDTQIPRQY